MKLIIPLIIALFHFSSSPLFAQATRDCSVHSTLEACSYSTGCTWDSTTNTCNDTFVYTPPQGNIPWNDLNQVLGNDQFSGGSALPGSILSVVLNYALVIAGLILLFMLISGGFTLLTNPTNPQAQEGGKQRLTWAVAGFVLLFSSYWIVQILEIIFKVEIV